MGSITTWIVLLGEQALAAIKGALIGNASSLFGALFAGKAPIGAGEAIFAALKGEAESFIGAISFKEAARARKKAYDSFINEARAKDNSQAGIQAIVTLGFQSNGVIAAYQKAELGYALLQIAVADAENGAKASPPTATAATVTAAQADRDAAAEYIDVLLGEEAPINVGGPFTLPVPPAALVAAINAAEAMVTSPPPTSAPGVIVPPPASSLMPPHVAISSVAPLAAQAGTSINVMSPGGHVATVNVPPGMSATVSSGSDGRSAAVTMSW